MAKFCNTCGKEIADDAQFCNSCGAKTGEPETTRSSDPGPASSWAGQTATEAFSPEDISANKVVAGLAYLLFFLPLIVCPDSRFGRFHANQGLVLLIVSFAGSIVLSLIPFVGVVLVPIFSLAVFVFAIMGLVNGLNGKAKELPLIGTYKILK